MDHTPKRVNEVSSSYLEQRVEEPTSLMRHFIIENQKQVKACGICSTVGHATDMCPTLQEEPIQ